MSHVYRAVVAVTVCVAAVCAIAGCDGSPQRTEPAPGPSAPARSPVHAGEPPEGAPFEAPEAFRPSGGGAAIEPPDMAAETWRAMTNQYRPHQKKTPAWQDLPATEAVELQMPPDSRYRCLVQPLRVSRLENDFGTELKAWSLLRMMICSSDGFSTWTEHAHQVLVKPDGSRDVALEAEARLRERDADGVRETVVRLRSSKWITKASTGPPKILEGVDVDE